ncbi:MAG: hypothetical protein JNM78_19905 [Cyclobacteriaceae bacterium]|nr:hypothetical protein [Cyclobacteriaceae bacterium]
MILFFLILAGLNPSYCQTSLPVELFGFRLGQYKDVVTNELGEPSQTQVMEDSTLVDFYYISKDSSTYMAFQYLPSKQKEINAIQLSGNKTQRSFYGIHLGDKEKKLNSTFGKADTILTQKFNNKKAETWRYNKLNLSILLVNRKVKSLRIWDDTPQKDYNHPTINELLEVIKTNDKSKIADILSPGLEVYYCEKVITWKNSFYKDIYQEKASVFDFITNTDYGLASLIGKKSFAPDLSLRVINGIGTFPVYKFSEESLITEIVLNFQQGKYKIWEVTYKCEN